MLDRDNQSSSKTEMHASKAIINDDIIDEIVVRFSNSGFSPNPSAEMKLSTEKSNCKGDYGCCGRLP